MGSKSSTSHIGKRVKAPYLGKIALYWCQQCNLPLLEKFPCEICNTHPKKVQITPPGDVRPAFPKDYEILRDVINSQYGAPIGNVLFSTNQIVLLNRIGGLDRSDEVIMFGAKLGILLFNPIKSKYEFRPKIFGGELILAIQESLKSPKKKQLELNSDGTSYILKGKSILAPGVKNFSSDIKNGDYILITYHPDNQHNDSKSILVSIGLAQANSEDFVQMLKKKYGALCKNNKHRTSLEIDVFLQEKVQKMLNHYKEDNKPVLTPLNSIINNLQTTFKSNRNYIQKEVVKAQNFIKSTIKSIPKPIAVAYSGGKDSLATLLLVWETIGPTFKIFFADTGLELPEVQENVKKIAETLHMEDKLVIKYAEDTFWKIVESFGPPSRDYRYCCHSLKAQNITSIIESLYDGKKILVFLGQRQYESITRSKSKKIYTNSFIPLQIAATPIKEWNALLLWLFVINFSHISQNQNENIYIPINPLYFEGHERLGCYLCPASNLSTFELLKTSHPDMYQQWFSYLESYRQKHKLPKEWIEWGLWRYKKLSLQWFKIVEKSGISLKFIKSDPSSPLNFELTKGFSPCLQDGYSIKGKFSEPIDLAELVLFLPTLTKNFEYDEELNVISIRSSWKKQNYTLNLYSDGALFLLSPSKNFPVNDYLQYFIGTIFRSQYCNQCKTCEMICPSKSISFIDAKIRIDSNTCTNCLKCISHCPFFQSAKKISLE
jgi:phosphoadenosine phosphosulfate reductase